jgi:predicted nucleic acid-binding protein
MNAEVFVDTNVLLYTVDEAPASAPKRQRAQQPLLSEP